MRPACGAGTVLAVICALASPAAALETFQFRLVGDNPALEQSLRRASLIAQADSQGVGDPLELFATARAEYGRLIGVFYEAGYYAPQISVQIDGREAADISPLAPPDQIGEIAITMVPGPAFAFGRAQIAPLADGTELPGDFAAGEPARSTVIRAATATALDQWRAQGHAKAAPTGQTITANHGAQALDVAITLTPGPRLRFGALRPEGQKAVRADRIVEIAGLPTGEVFSPDDVDRATERLRATGTFSSVAMRQAETANPDGTLDISAAVVEAPPRRIGAGLEYDTERGVKLSGFWLHRNLLGGAERFRIEGMIDGIGANVGGLDYALELDFTRPATLTPDTTFTIGLDLETESEDDFDASRIRADALLVHRYSDRLTFSGGLGLLAERADFGPGRTIRRDYQLLLLPLAATWDQRDDQTNPKRGLYANGTVTPFFGTSGTGAGVQATADLRGYYPMGDRLVLAGRAQFGIVQGPGLADTPRDFLFYSGGGGSVRGQPYRSLGVTSGGVDSGGQGFAATSLELRMRATEELGIAAFLDAGYVSEGAFSGASDWHAGAGVGLRYDTVIGPLRLDVGLPVGGSTSNGAQLYLGIGQAF
ncbi:MAG: autotransporter translocation and assembly module outer membrane component TamA [Roseibaca calidilacus]|uniref:Autotransporter translocation and assembly module outer membrane component TamA n=1 Tax=Roseibaca calidilacus TaxID=1666912 RepID=A0A0P8AA05_9RHOB|nr:BamA/TamA family outer membrane protein [Roseibaca calidilacus]KPP91002.1 MAG: autotransporter translocation and assembly module outer membrane component TamA [Roseibaca calidilacus]CUX83954.1 translocation and assembly module TamA [Roseibaca calidilacus]